jgi:predicted GIY-YIG superfamily endonuclease
MKAVGGVYLVLKRANGTYNLLYVGQTGDLSERFEDHHKAACFDRNGKTHIATRGEGSEQKRLAIEADLIRNYQPTCNG